MDKTSAWKHGSASRLLPLLLVIVIGLAAPGHGASDKAPRKKRFFVVSSYHREYNWSIETNRGFCAAMLRWKFFDNEAQVAEFTRNDRVETSGAVVRKMWMDSKRK